jgi:ribosomal protein S6
MRTYELVVVVKTSVKEADRKKLFDQIKEWLGTVKVAEENDWGQKALAYPIKKQDAGYYYQFKLEGETFPKGFETRLIQHNDILRHLVVRTK